jgi:hypothetical protein
LLKNGWAIFHSFCALLLLIIEIDFSLQKEVSMILVGYLVEAAPQVLIWWAVFYL